MPITLELAERIREIKRENDAVVIRNGQKCHRCGDYLEKPRAHKRKNGWVCLKCAKKRNNEMSKRSALLKKHKMMEDSIAESLDRSDSMGIQSIHEESKEKAIVPDSAIQVGEQLYPGDVEE